MYFKNLFLTVALIFCCVLIPANISFAQENPTNPPKTYLQIPEDTTITLINIENLDSDNTHKFDLAHFTLANDFVLNGQTILTKGSKLQGIVTKAHGSRLFGESGIIRIKLDDINLTDGTTLHFANDLKLKGGKNYTGLASSIVVPFSGFLLKGREVNCPAGSVIEYVFENDD